MLSKNKLIKIKEGKTNIFVYPKEKRDVSKKLDVFYNPVMKLNRDISLEILKQLPKNSKIALPLSGSGVRGVRILNELSKKEFFVYFNDINKKATSLIKKNLRLNNLNLKNSKNSKAPKYLVSNQDANIFLLETGQKEKKFDYVDVDPFGSPNPFLDNAIKMTKRNGILAVTATDTAPLCGTYPKACLRKYWSVPMRNELMHEMGLRILIRKIQLIGAQYEKALTPLLSYSLNHYFRAFFKVEVSKEKTNQILKQHKTFSWFNNSTGPLWLGKLSDLDIIKKIDLKDKNNEKIIEILKQENKKNIIGFYHVPSLCKRKNISFDYKIDELVAVLKRKGYYATRTHFDYQAIKTDCRLDMFYKILITKK